MPSATAEELSEPLLPREDPQETQHTQIDVPSGPPPLDEDEEEVLPSADEDGALIEEGRRRNRRVVEQQRARSSSSAATAAVPPSSAEQPQEVVRPSGPCYLVKEFFYLVIYLIHRPIFSDPTPDNPFRVQVRFIKFFVVTLLGIFATHMVVLAFVSCKQSVTQIVYHDSGSTFSLYI